MKKTLNIIILAAFVLLIFFLLKSFVIGFYNVRSNSMSPRLISGDRIIVNKMIYNFGGNINIGDVIVFKQNDAENINLVKRIAALPLDTVLFDEKNIFVNGRPIRHNDYKKVSNDLILEEIVLRQSEVFVIGDNFSNSIDSREFGAVNISNIFGRAIVIYYSKENGKSKTERIGEIIK
jgi:signal peptidase I